MIQNMMIPEGSKLYKPMPELNAGVMIVPEMQEQTTMAANMNTYVNQWQEGGAVSVGSGVQRYIENRTSFYYYNANIGGAIYNNGYVTIGDGVIFRNNIASNNSTSYYNGGGAIYNRKSMSIGDNASFNGNSAYYNGGGAIYNDGYVIIGDGVTFRKNIALNNSAYCGGGAICNRESMSIGNNASFNGNSAYCSGGAIYNGGYESTFIEIGNNASFCGNNASFGGAIYAWGSMFIGNNATFSDNAGGAIWGSIGERTIGDNATFIGNSAFSAGGAINAGNSTTIGSNAVFIRNTAASKGGAIYNPYGSMFIGNNAVFSRNAASKGGAIYTSSYLELMDCEFKTSTDTIYIFGGKMVLNGNASAAGNITIKDDLGHDYDGELVNNGTIDFNISVRQANDGLLLNDWTKVSGGGNYAVTVSARQSTGEYQLIGNAGNFNKTLTIHGDNGSAWGALALNQSLQYGDISLTLKLDETTDVISLQIDSPYAAPAIKPVNGDFDGDGIADVLMSNGSDAGAWTIHDGIPNWLGFSKLPGSWKVFGTGNANGDLCSDIYLYDAVSNQIGIWTTSSTGVTGWMAFNPFTANVKAQLLGDFDGDGFTDIVLRGNDGAVNIQFATGKQWNQSVALPADIVIQGTGDINGDGIDDLILRKDRTIGAWLMDAAGPRWVTLSDVSSSAEIIGLGDFNGDGTKDVLIRQDGNYGAWLMKNGSIAEWKNLMDLPYPVNIEFISDYNGDGIDDLRIRDGNLLASLIVKNNSVECIVFGDTRSDWNTEFPSKSKTTALRNDINGNGIADIVMLNSPASDAGAWLLDAKGNPSWLGLSGLPGTWELFDTGNANGDIYSDVFLYDAVNKDFGVWTMNAKGVPGWESWGQLEADCDLIATRDFNGDGLTDVLYRRSNGAIGTYMNQTGEHFEVPLPLNWNMVGVGDINGDGTADLILRNGNSIGAWLMSANGPRWQGLADVGSINRIVGLGDFNGDGTADILFNSNGSYGAWLMKDGQITGWKAFCDFPTSMAVEAIGDYNGDGIDDLRVRNGNDLAAVMVYTDGLEWKGFGSVPSDWKTSLAGPV